MEDILRFLRRYRIGGGVCEGCIAKGINVAPLQKVDSEIKHLMNLGKVRLMKTQCLSCGRTQECVVLRT